MLDGWLVHDGSGGSGGARGFASDAACVDELTRAGISTRAVPLLMTDPAATAALAAATLALAGALIVTSPPAALTAVGVPGLPEVRPGDDLAALVATALAASPGRTARPACATATSSS